MEKKRKNSAQSTLEYILILTAIVGLLLFAARTWIAPNIEDSLDNAGTAMGRAADKF